MTTDHDGPSAESQAQPPVAEAQEPPQPQSQTPATGDDKQQPASSTPPAKPTDGQPAAEPKLTGAQLKAKAKAEKAARRAKEKDAKEVAKGEAAVSSQPGQLGPSAAEVKSKQKPKYDAPSPANAAKMAAARSAAPALVAPVEPKITVPECFSHIPMARKLPMTSADKDVHPSVLCLGQQMAAFAIDENTARLQATLLAFKEVIASYTTPPGNTLARHLTPHVLNPQIDYLTACRPMCFSMGNAIRWLKLQVSKINPDVAEEEAKSQLYASIDNFIQERITVADLVITEKAAERIQEDQVILTLGHSSIVERAILHAHSVEQKKFHVIATDDPFDRRGQDLAKTLAAAGISTTYSGDFGALQSLLQQASVVLVSAEAMFNNGALYARSGTSDVALAAKHLSVPVDVLCHTINITERVTSDSQTYNEIDPERSTAESFRLLYDTTPHKYLSVVVTELGTVQPNSVPDLLRKLEESN